MIVGFCASSAAAQEELPGARLSLEAPPRCASWQELVDGVARRSSRIHLASTGTRYPSLRASLQQSAAGVIVAELAVTQESGKRSVRRLSARSCSEAIDALALVIAITLDPAFTTEVADPASERAPPGTAVKGDVTPPRGEAGGHAQSNFPAASDADGQPVNSAVRLRVGASFGLLLGPAPALMPGVALSVGVSWEHASLWSPALSLSAAHYWVHGLVQAYGEADFEVDSARLAACPVRIGDEPFALRPCLSLELGRLFARGRNTFAPQTHSRPFGVFGGSLSLEAPLFRGFAATLDLAAGKTLVMDDFAFSPTTFHRVAPITLATMLGAALRFR